MKSLTRLTRRSFVETAGMGLAAAAALAGSSTPSEAQLVYRKSDWHSGQFDKLMHIQARVKQVFDIRGIGEGKFLNNVKNSLNGLQFGFGIPMDSIHIATAMHGPSNMLNFDDAAWQKYGIGKLVQVDDPKTGAPAVRNIYFAQKESKSQDPDNPESTFQDASLQALHARGVTFLSCHTATEEQVRGFVKSGKMQGSTEEIVNDLQSHVLPGVIVVPAMVAAIALLQSEGHFSYITV
jgi:intracellular sulfur oxidation DsrE/DsrF family protein